MSDGKQMMFIKLNSRRKQLHLYSSISLGLIAELDNMIFLKCFFESVFKTVVKQDILQYQSSE